MVIFSPINHPIRRAEKIKEFRREQNFLEEGTLLQLIHTFYVCPSTSSAPSITRILEESTRAVNKITLNRKKLAAQRLCDCFPHILYRCTASTNIITNIMLGSAWNVWCILRTSCGPTLLHWKASVAEWWQEVVGSNTGEEYLKINKDFAGLYMNLL